MSELVEEDYGIDETFMKSLGEQMQPGGSAIFALVRKGAPDKVIGDLGRFGGTVLRTSLSKEAEERLQSTHSQGKE